jgi:hypothetical protein
VLFERAFQHSPVVLTAVATEHEAAAVVGQIRTVGKIGFYYRLREQERNALQHAAETVFYLAWEPSVGQVGSLAFEVGKTPMAVTQQFYPIVFRQAPLQQSFQIIPGFLTAVATVREADAETLFSIAWGPSSGMVGSVTFEIGKTAAEVIQQFYPSVSMETIPKVPIFLAHSQTTSNADASTLRWRNKDHTGVDVRIAEEQSKDAETSVIPEVVGYILIR